MKSGIRVSIALTLFFQAGLALAQLAVEERPAVVVQGDAEILVDPDYAVLRIAVQHTGTNLLGVRGRNEAAVETLLADAGKLGVPAADLASTPSMAFPGRWQCEACTDAERRSGYSARSSITLTLRKMDLLRGLVERLGDDAALQLEDVEYRTTALRQHRDSARGRHARRA